MAKQDSYPATLEIDYPKQLNRVSSFFRIIFAIPILIVMGSLTSPSTTTYMEKAGNEVTSSGAGIAGGLFFATLLMIVFRRRYPKWWFNFNLELNRFCARVGAYVFLLTDKYPSTEDQQSVHLDVKYPNVEKELNNLLPIVKWLLAIPHYIVLAFLMIGALFATIIAWFSIFFTSKYPEGLFNYVVGVGRWSLRVTAYAFLLTTDKYPPFSLK